MSDEKGTQGLRLDDLVAMRSDLQTRMAACTSDQNYAGLGRLLVDVLKQIEELGGGDAKPKETGLSDFEKRLRERKSAAAPARGAAG